MAGSSFDHRIRRRNPPPWPAYLAFLVLGVAIGWAGSSMTARSRKATAEEVVASPTPVPLQALRIIARPGRGLSLTATGPVKLESPGASKLAEQKDKSVFVGFRNWSGTVRYLLDGKGTLFLRDKGNVTLSGGWKPEDYRKFVGGKPLEMKVRHEAPYNLYFQRNGSSPILLGAFSVALG